VNIKGYTATAGEHWARAELCEEAMHLGRMLAALAAGESETHALVALMEIQASRLRARTGPDGEIVTLDKQDRARWDRLLITHGLAALDRAEEIGGTGSYAIQARSRPATPEHRALRTPTGCASPACTATLSR
jgi:predicted RNA polymerase sigma factor